MPISPYRPGKQDQGLPLVRYYFDNAILRDTWELLQNGGWTTKIGVGIMINSNRVEREQWMMLGLYLM